MSNFAQPFSNFRRNSICRRPSTPARAAAAPLVSIIIPCYNAEQYLREAIESVLRQSHAPVEILVVDNGSTDRSGQIAQQYPVRYLRLDAPNLCAARNAGIRESSGAYLAFLDADDRLMPRGIEAGVRLLEERPEYAMTVGDHVFISRDGAWHSGSSKKCLQGSHYGELLRSNFIEMISSALFRRSLFERVGLFDVSLRAAEDYDLYLRIARENSILCHPKVIAEYRIHEAELSRNSEVMLASSLLVLERQRPFVGENDGLRAAYAYGMRFWRRKYGRQLALELAFSDRSGGVADFRRKLRMLARQYPLGICIMLALRLLPAGAIERLRLAWRRYAILARSAPPAREFAADDASRGAAGLGSRSA